jgi:hypothetical protein
MYIKCFHAEKSYGILERSVLGINTYPKVTAKPLLIEAIMSSKELKEFEHTLELGEGCHLLEVLLD